MPKKFDPETLELLEPKVNSSDDPKQEIYLVIQDGVWEGDTTLQIEAFTKFDDALATFNQWVADAKVDMREWCDKDQIEEDIAVNAECEQAHYETYQRGNSSILYDEIYIRKEKVK